MRKGVGVLAVCAGMMIGLGPATAAATGLPDGRAYELVSPADKNGTDVLFVGRTSGDGRSIAWTSRGGYAQTPGVNVTAVYAATRGPSGWTTRSTTPSFARVTTTASNALTGYLWSDDLADMAFSANGSFDPGDQDVNAAGTFGQPDVYLLPRGGSTTFLSHAALPDSVQKPASLVGMSGDGRTVLLTTAEPLVAPIAPGSTVTHLYAWRDGHLTAAGVDGSGDELAGGSVLGTGRSSSAAQIGGSVDNVAVSADGSRYVFASASGSNAGFGAPVPIWLHRDGQPNVQISASQRTGTIGQPAPTGANVLTAVDDVRRIYLQSPDQLTDDAPVGGGDYVYDVASGSLSFVAVDDSLAGDTSSGLTRVSDDGTHVYFVSPAVLAAGADPGAPNLYLRTPSTVTLVATLDPADASDWSSPINAVTPTPAVTTTGMTPDGSHLVFQSVVPLTGAPTNGYSQVYVYDAETDAITCASCRADGSSAGASVQRHNAAVLTNVQAAPRVISDDGTKVFFGTTDALVAQDVNGVEDVYEHTAGQGPSLISSGSSSAPSLLSDVSPDGADAYFLTRESLVVQDDDGGRYDVYDARVGGGFPVLPPPAPCEGDACQGPPTAPPDASPPGSVGLVDPGNLDPGPDPLPAVRITRQRIKGSTLTLRMHVSAPGRVTVRGPLLRTASAAAHKAGSVEVRVRLTRKAASALRRRHRLSVRASVRFAPQAGTPSATATTITAKA